MKTRKKAVIVGIAMGALAATSGVALAAAAGPTSASKATSTSASQVPDQPAVRATGEIQGGIVAAQIESSVVKEPGSLTIVVQGQKTGNVSCLTDVRAWVYAGGALATPRSSAADTSKIKLAVWPHRTGFRLHVSFPKGAATGTWYLTSVVATACGTKADPWNAQWDGYDSFTVQR